MKSKHIANGKKVAICDFRGYHFIDNLLHKSRMTALAKVRSFRYDFVLRHNRLRSCLFLLLLYL